MMCDCVYVWAQGKLRSVLSLDKAAVVKKIATIISNYLVEGICWSYKFGQTQNNTRITLKYTLKCYT